MNCRILCQADVKHVESVPLRSCLRSLAPEIQSLMTEPLTYPHVLRRAYFGTRGATETRDIFNAATIISVQVCAWWRRCNRGAETSRVTYGTHDGGPESSPTGAQDLWLCADQRTLERQLSYGRDFFSRGSICRLHSLLCWAEVSCSQ